MLKQEKERVVAEIVERLRTSETLLVADYRGLTHAELDRVRTELLKLGARFAVVKNTLTRRAAETAGVDTLDEFLTGPTAIAFITEGDAVGVAKVLSDTARETRRLTLKGGVMQGRVVGSEAVRELATLPPAEILRGQLLGAIVGPVSAVVGLFTAPLRDLVGVLDARIRQLGEQSDGAEPEAEAPAAAEDGPVPPAAATADAEAAAPPEEPAADEPAAEESAADTEVAPAPQDEAAPDEPPVETEAEPEEAEDQPADESENQSEPEIPESDEPETPESDEPETQREES